MRENAVAVAPSTAHIAMPIGAAAFNLLSQLCF
jgi:hypothetical protein